MKIFLSSTYVDLIEHRKVAADVLERLGQQSGRMEVFGARPQEPSEVCLNEIDGCDLFVGLYAHRYGYIPAGLDISITEAEFRYARKKNKPVFCFLIDDTHPWPPNMIEGEPGRTKLAALKEEIAAHLVRDTFTTPENLASRLATAIGRHIALSRYEAEHSDDLIIDIGSCSAPNPAIGVGEVRFTLSNSGKYAIKVTSLVLRVLERPLSAKTLLQVPAGPIDEHFLFARIGEDTDSIELFTQHFLLKPSDTEGFFLKIDAVEGYLYKLQLAAHWHYIGEIKRRAESKEFTIEFPARSPEGLLRLARRLKR